MIKKIKQAITRLRLNAFYAAPLKDVDGISVINQLRDSIGISVGDYKTLITDYISAGTITHFNGASLQLLPQNDIVYLIVNGGTHIEPTWRISDILHELNKKNTEASMTATQLVELIQLKVLTVKFNVRKTDHGTRWQIDKAHLKHLTKLIDRPSKHKRYISRKHKQF